MVLAALVPALLLLLALLAHAAQGYVCMHYQRLEPGVRYAILSPGWPASYQAGESCQWVAEAPPEQRVAFECDEFYLPGPNSNESLACSDVLLASSSGMHINLDGMPYIGRDTVVSQGNVLNVELRSAYRGSAEGRFRCYAQATTEQQWSVRARPVFNSTSESQFERQAVATNPDYCSCGWKLDGQGSYLAGRITNGIEVRPNEYPMMAALVDGDAVVCGAVLIASRFALTSAHCLRGLPLEMVDLVVGEFDTTFEVEGTVQQRLKLAEFVRHPSWSNDWKRGNIAIAKTKEEVRVSLFAGPACVPNNKSADQFLVPGENLVILGWGASVYGGQTSTRLKLMNAPLINPNECIIKYGQLYDEHFCTGSINSQSVCTGDPGGPLLWKSPRTHRYMVAGIIAYGDGCSGSAIINTKVSSYMDWIREVTQNNICYSR
ncbi:venom serine protease-like [Frankliniella occidentalis]|uniref:Venom serine protease-like n=1 Tax=Frankliniella occidentalis TaxID=133901 RepID=A0A6J1S609_FRAOC|nr:venom serine protease-like [Frankliniella occidentalis]